MPPQITNNGNLISMMSGDTAVTVGIATAYAAIAITGVTLAGVRLATWRHWREVRKAGHYDDGIDPTCAALVGLNDDERRHCEEWSRADRERFRVAIVAAKDAGQPVEFKWRPVHGDARELRIEPRAGGGYRITAIQGIPA